MSITLSPRYDCFELDINLSLRKPGIGNITCYEDSLDIDFLGGENGVTIEYSKNKLDHLPRTVELALLRWKGEDGVQLSGNLIERIRDHIKEHLEDIEEGLKEIS